MTDLYNGGSLNGTISETVKLNNAHVINDTFSTKGLPGFYTGDRNAKTVFVTLNPGCDAAIADCMLPCEIAKLKIKTSSLTDLINSYHHGRTYFGQLTPNKRDPFDVKQAALFGDAS